MEKETDSARPARMRPNKEDLLGISDEPEVKDFDPGDWAEVRHQGVGVDWLAGAFRMDRRKVRAKLGGLKPMGEHKTPTGMRPVYDLREAAAYLVPNIEGLSHAIRNMKTSDLPPDLQKDVWDARLKELQWREKAGELWPTENVVEVFSDTFMNMKGQLRMWVDQLADTTFLSEDQRRRLIEMVDALQADLYARLVEMPSQKSTPSVLGDEDGV